MGSQFALLPAFLRDYILRSRPEALTLSKRSVTNSGNASMFPIHFWPPSGVVYLVPRRFFRELPGNPKSLPPSWVPNQPIEKFSVFRYLRPQQYLLRIAQTRPPALCCVFLPNSQPLKQVFHAGSARRISLLP